MAGESRIIALEPEGPAPQGASAPIIDPSGGHTPPHDRIEPEAPEAPAPSPPSLVERLIPTLAGLMLAGWSAAYLAAHLTAIRAGASLAQALGWIEGWSGPALLILVVGLFALRSGRRESRRFVAGARALAAEAEALEARLARTTSELSLARGFLAEQNRELDSLGRLAVERIAEPARVLQHAIHDNSAELAAIAAVSTAARENMEHLRGQLPVITTSAKDVTSIIGHAGRIANSQLAELVTGLGRLNEFGLACERLVETTHTRMQDALHALETRLTRIDAGQNATIGVAQSQLNALAAAGGNVMAALDHAASRTDAAITERLSAQSQRLAELNEASAATSANLAGITAQVNALAATIATTEATASERAAHFAESFGQSQRALSEAHTAITALGDDGARLLALIEASVAQGHELPAALAKSTTELAQLATHATALTDALGGMEASAARTMAISEATSQHVEGKLESLAAAIKTLEAHLADLREQAAAQVDDDFSRRAATITDTLNSNAIGIARALDSEVADTAWAGYLRGDRGIFTRRAVKLLDAAEGKAIARLYAQEPGFREHVSHYIHDFEAMLRQLLATRDGHALGVTLLSSDMGKLYVALAQAIDRLRD